MVRRSTFQISFSIALVALAGTLAGCSVRSWWGEKPKSAETVRTAQNGSGCPEAMGILNATSDAQSLAVLECWASNLLGAWDQVEGSRPNTLSDQEIGTLVRKGVIKISGDRETAIRRILSAKFLGFGNEVTREKFEEWLAWVRGEHAELRRLHFALYGQIGANPVPRHPVILRDRVLGSQQD